MSDHSTINFHETNEYSDPILEFISTVLMDEDMKSKICTSVDLLALQAAEKYFHEALVDKNSPTHNQIPQNLQHSYPSDRELLKGKNSHSRSEDFEVERGRSNKLVASFADEIVLSETFDKVLLCLGETDAKSNLQLDFHGGKSGRRRQRGKSEESMDANALLIQCAQSVAAYDHTSAAELLMQIRQYASPYGNGPRRLAYYFADALEARLAGTGAQHCALSFSNGLPAADFLAAYHLYQLFCPFDNILYLFNRMVIMDLAAKASKLHIVHFGILYGFRWPLLIQHLSKITGGPPTLRITGIEFPQPGFKPAQRVEETGQRLAHYCKRFNVPFEYNAIARDWESIQIKDLKLESDEVLIVVCTNRLRNLPDETVVPAESNPRDKVLKLIKKMNPRIFIHGVINGSFNSPFFVARFREVLFHFSPLFDMFDSIVPGHNRERMFIEREIYGREIMNVVASEGGERVERPETYKQWQIRNQRAGLNQIPLDKEIIEKLKAKVREEYHKEFLITQDGGWMLQGWKGRVTFAVSCWNVDGDDEHN